MTPQSLGLAPMRTRRSERPPPLVRILLDSTLLEKCLGDLNVDCTHRIEPLGIILVMKTAVNVENTVGISDLVRITDPPYS